MSRCPKIPLKRLKEKTTMEKEQPEQLTYRLLDALENGGNDAQNDGSGITDGGSAVSDEELRQLLDGDGAGDILLAAGDMTEAASRKWGRAVDAEQEWQRFAKSHGMGRRSGLRRAAVWLASAAAAAAVGIAVMLLRGADREQYLYRAADVQARPEVRTNGGVLGVADGAMGIYDPRMAEGTCTVSVPYGKTQEVVLDDGTEVWLNSNSTLEYSSSLGSGVRSVRLEGEAYFKVAHDASRPFVIDAGAVRARVLGTELNVRSYSGGEPHVTLVNGSVEVAETGDGAVVRIEPGEDAALSGGRLSVRDVNVDDFTCWRDGIVYFDHEQLRNILTELGSWYNVNVICRDKALLGRHYHYVFNRHAALEEALQLLNDVSDAEVRLENGTIFID